MAKNTKADIRTFEQTIITGLQAVLPKRTISIAGVDVKSVAFAAQVREHLAALDAVDNAKLKYLELVAEERAKRKALKPLVAGLRNYLLVLYSETSSEFRSFGFKPRAVATKSVEAKANAVVKSRATRQARHTKGRRQKMAIVGTIEVAPSVSEPATHTAVTNGVTNGASTNGAIAH
jgi:hypothetical protein